MKFKLDENFGSRSLNVLRDAGHDAETVVQEQLGGARDEVIYDACVSEHRCLLTLDLDFADVIRFPPHEAFGIAVLRIPKGASRQLLDQLVGNLLSMLDREPIVGRLWIVEAGRIRVHASTKDDSDFLPVQ